MRTFRSSTAGDALLMGSALDVVIQQARDGPSARAPGRYCWFGRPLSEASVILRVRRCAHALAALVGQVDLARSTTRSPVLISPPRPSTAAFHPSSRYSTPTNRTTSSISLQHSLFPQSYPSKKHLQNDWRQIRRQGQRLKVQRPIVSISLFTMACVAVFTFTGDVFWHLLTAIADCLTRLLIGFDASLLVPLHHY
jgi:hypothetical protein